MFSTVSSQIGAGTSEGTLIGGNIFITIGTYYAALTSQLIEVMIANSLHIYIIVNVVIYKGIE